MGGMSQKMTADWRTIIGSKDPEALAELRATMRKYHLMKLDCEFPTSFALNLGIARIRNGVYLWHPGSVKREIDAHKEKRTEEKERQLPPKKIAQQPEEFPEDDVVVLYFDGSCLNNGSSPAYGAFLIKAKGAILHSCRFKADEQEGTNNVAEWAGLLAGLRYVRTHYPEAPIQIYGDSQLVIYQLIGKYRCKKEHLQKYLTQAQELLEEASWRADWIPRDKNIEADALSKHHG